MRLQSWLLKMKILKSRVSAEKKNAKISSREIVTYIEPRVQEMLQLCSQEMAPDGIYQNAARRSSDYGWSFSFKGNNRFGRN